MALAGLIPVPFVDTWIQGRLRSELIRSLGHHHAVPLEPAVVRTLARSPGNVLVGCVMGLVWWPIKKLIRKVVYVLTVKDAVDALADTFVRGEMVRLAFSAGLLPHASEQVRTAMDAAMSAHTRSPLWGPKTPHDTSVADTDDSGMVRLLARTADRAGGAAALADFRARLQDLEPPPTAE